MRNHFVDRFYPYIYLFYAPVPPRSRTARSRIHVSLSKTTRDGSRLDSISRLRSCSWRLFTYTHTPRRAHGTWPGAEQAGEPGTQGLDWPGPHAPLNSIRLSSHGPCINASASGPLATPFSSPYHSAVLRVGLTALGAGPHRPHASTHYRTLRPGTYFSWAGRVKHITFLV